MCTRWGSTAHGWRVRPVTQAPARSVGPCVGDTGASRCIGTHPLIAVLVGSLAPLFVGMPSAKRSAPYRPGLAWLPIAPRCLASPLRLCLLAVCHLAPKMWHAVCKEVATLAPVGCATCQRLLTIANDLRVLCAISCHSLPKYKLHDINSRPVQPCLSGSAYKPHDTNRSPLSNAWY